MARELAATLLLLPVAGCSWLLDFSDQAIPVDAALDAPFDVAACAYREPNDTPATAAAVTPADTGPGAICPADSVDHDFYKITVPASTATVSIRIGFPHRAGDLDLRLYDKAGGAVLAESHGFDEDEAIVCPSPQCPALGAADYVFEVFPGVPGAANDYTIAIALTPM